MSNRRHIPEEQKKLIITMLEQGKFQGGQPGNDEIWIVLEKANRMYIILAFFLLLFFILCLPLLGPSPVI